jgi:hypothetical protein
VNLPESEPANDSLATLWARKRIDQLTNKRATLSDGRELVNLNQEITQVGLEFRLLTDNTSFVAVEERVVNQNGKPVTIQVPVAIPEGVDPEMGGAKVDRYGDPSAKFAALSNGVGSGGGGGGGRTETVNVTNSQIGRRASKAKARKDSGIGSGSGTGVGYGSGSGSGSGGGNGSGPPPAAAYSTVPSVGTMEDNPSPPSPPLTPETIRTKTLKAKLHAWVYALVDRLEKKTTAGPNEALFVRDGKAEIRITISGKSSDVLEKLQKAGFEVVSEKGDVMTGRIAIEKVAALAEIDKVVLVLPKI